MLYGEIGAKTVVFSVYDYDRFSRHDPIGELQIPLNTVDLGKVIRETKDIKPPPGEQHDVCLLKIYICFVFLLIKISSNIGQQIR